MKLSYQLVLDQIDEKRLMETLTLIDGLAKKYQLRVRFKKDGRTSSQLRDLSDVILEMLQN